MRIIFALLIALLPFLAEAHEVRPAFLKLTELPAVSNSQRFEASFRQPQINGRFLGLVVVSNCDSQNVGASVSDGALIEVAVLECPEAGLEFVEIAGLERTLIDTLVSITWLDGSITNRLITAQAGRLDLNSELPALPIYLSVGLMHLLMGFDHILFVLMLLYLVRSLRGIVLVVSSFTLAHSITLGLAAFDIVSLSQSPIEAVIAASIALLAYENLQRRETLSHKFPALVALAFGLLHGLGFAGALQEIGLPQDSQLVALLLFNVGIELGQLAIVVAALFLVTILPARFKQAFGQVPIYLAGGVASFWFMQRAWLIVLPALS